MAKNSLIFGQFYPILLYYFSLPLNPNRPLIECIRAPLIMDLQLVKNIKSSNGWYKKLWGQRNCGPGPGPVYLRVHGPSRGGLLPRTTTCSALHQMPKERNELSVWGRVREKAANTVTLSTASYKPILRSLPMRLSSNSQPL